jgi:hypothetical protein
VRHLTLATVLLLAAGGSVRAQTGSGTDWRGRGYLTVTGDYQASSSSFDGMLTLPKFVESEKVTSTYKIVSAPGFDLAGGVRIWRNLAVGGGLTRFTTRNPAAVSASIPHPFFFNRARQISGDAGIRHQETAVHVHAAWVAPVGSRWEIAIFGGPSLFTVAQGLVTDISYNDSYPYDTPAFVGASIENQSKSKIGAHAGADVAFIFARHIGVSGVVRFSRSSLRYGTANGQSVRFDAGGVQAGVGLWLRL